MQPREVLFNSLVRGQGFVAQVGELQELLLNFLKPFMSLEVHFSGICSVSRSQPMPFIQQFDLRDFRSETLNLVAQDFKMIHVIQDTAFQRLRRF
jgi:hypothetical protein